ncbi:hypothetical protein L6452_11663 [Arctium lappa]|uniref:Uncharacterized protein n=1 Tax=Arctium lappa TaxID=4217 RepID=A0ACB9DPY9_ARCLA|nr:hypothetical protein L6452_11663 [Arctium lappa]
MFGETPQPKAKYAHLINTIGQDGADLSLQEPKTSSARLRPKTSSEAEDFSIFRSRRLLSLRSRRLLSLRSRRPLILQEPKNSSATEDSLIFKA